MKQTSNKSLPFNLELSYGFPHLARIHTLASNQAWPYLQAAGLPKYIVENPKVMPPVYEMLRHRHCLAFSNIDENSTLAQEITKEGYHWGNYKQWTQLKLWYGLLEHLTELSNRDIAVEFDRWSRRHWFPGKQLDRARDEWQNLLQDLTDPTTEHIKVPIPNFLESLIPDLRELVSYAITDIALPDLIAYN
jgi:hypothetical protein